MRVSVIIPNYNYAEFLGRAIESALGLDAPDVEVIVVDDGSTDTSREVIESYGTRIAAYFQRNGGQRIACNNGFARSHGDLVIFLDSDDVLEPAVISEALAVWSPSVSKVQFQMRAIDANGKPLDSVFPRFHPVPSAAQIRQWVKTSSAYPTPPGSGNVYSRWFLEAIMPMDDSAGEAADSQCLAAAPLLGDVVTVAKPLVHYRVHGRNDGAFSEIDRFRFGRELQRAQNRFAYSQRIARRQGIVLPDRVVKRSLANLSYRIASFKLAPERHPIDNDSLPRIAGDLVLAAGAAQGYSMTGQAGLVAWLFLIMGLPNRLAKALILWRYAPGSRPLWLRNFLKKI